MNTITMTQSPENQNLLQRSLSPNTAVRASSENERFPSFDYSAQPNAGLPVLSESPAEAKQIEYKWPSRRASQRQTSARQPSQLGHRPRRSVSDAITKLRYRQGSVSENAQELAEALKAPVSYKLIVSNEEERTSWSANTTSHSV